MVRGTSRPDRKEINMAEIIGTRDLSEITNLSEKTIRELARDGLPSHRVGGCLAFDAKEALDWLDASSLLDSDEEDEVEAEDEDEQDDEAEEGDESDDEGDAA
jgi:hypothetical protein